MKTDYRDIVIAGGGMVGVSLALLLGDSLPEETSICLVEGFPLPQPGGEGGGYHPAFDARSTALSYSSRVIYDRLGIWGGLSQWACDIETIHVSRRGRFGSALLNAADYGWPALGHVVENAWLGRSLVDALRRRGRVEVISPATVRDARCDTGGVSLDLEGVDLGVLRTGLLVVADGAASALRNALGVAVQDKAYGQHALIANIESAQPHRGCAFERFTDSGPLALLPLLPAAEGTNRSALVWTLPPQESDRLRNCSPREFLSELQDRYGYRMGRLLRVGERHAYPLSLVRATEQVRQGVAVMGNAAHALHPVAGQGFNLALRDAAQLASVLARAARDGEACGALEVLQRYEYRQREDQRRTIEISDRLPGLFALDDPVVGLARDLALSGLDILPPLKRGFVSYAAGAAALGG